jgi:WD40 repeat protein
MALATRRGVEVLAFDGQPIHSISVGPMSFVAFSPNGVFIGAGGDDGKVALISANSGEEIISEQASRTHVQSLAMSPDSKLLAAGFVDGTIRLWNTADGKFAKFKAPAAK